MLVCKFWQDIALSLLSHDFSIKLTGNQLDLLAKDLEDYPSIAKKISRITIIEGPSSPTSSAQFMAVVNACSGPLELHFDTMHIYQYLVMLYCTRSVVPDIQKVRISGIETSFEEDIGDSFAAFDDLDILPSDMVQLYLMVNFRFRSTITTIYVILSSGNYYGSLKDYGGLIEYIASFPLLQCLKVKCLYPDNREDELRLPLLLNRTPRLVSLNLDGFYFARVTDLSHSYEFPHLTHLKLTAESADTNFLKSLVSIFKNLQSIEVIIEDVLPSHNPTLTKPEMRDQLEEFGKYAEAILQHHICYRYEHTYLCKENDASIFWTRQHFRGFFHYSKPFPLQRNIDDSHLTFIDMLLG